MTILTRGFTALAGLISRFSATSRIRSRRNSVQLRMPLAAICRVGFRVDEKEIVLNHFVKVPRREFYSILMNSQSAGSV